MEYIVRAHVMKDNSSLASLGSMKRIVNANKNLVLTMIKEKDPDKSYDDPFDKNEVFEMRQASQWGGKKPQDFHTWEENISAAPMLALPSFH